MNCAVLGHIPLHVDDCGFSSELLGMEIRRRVRVMWAKEGQIRHCPRRVLREIGETERDEWNPRWARASQDDRTEWGEGV